MFGYHDVTDDSDDAMVPPLCWITNAFDRSPAELLWVDSNRWGPLGGALLNFSYGNGKVFVVPHEEVGGKMQGGMCALDLPAFPTGIMRGRFNPQDGQLYCCGTDKDMRAEIRFAYQPHETRGKSVPITITFGSTKKEVRINMKEKATIANAFVSLGEFDVKLGDTISVVQSTEKAGGFVHADAIQILSAK